METKLAPEFINTVDGIEAKRILGKCVHCGFCTATCPTYQLLGDELDGPRGRIYLIKQIAEGQAPTEKTRTHLDRCLTCRNCESTCPSGVEYGKLVDIGRKWAEEKTAPRPVGQKLTRWLLKEGLTNKPLFDSAMRIGRIMRPLMPASLARKVPNGLPAGPKPNQQHNRKMLMLDGCVQPGMLPNINHATLRVFDALGVQLISAPKAGCCGALRYHLNDQVGGLADAKCNIDAWWPFIENGKDSVEAIVMNASGCGVMVKDYGHLLADDPVYANKAERVSQLCKDVSELLPEFKDAIISRIGAHPKPGVVYHPPCTLQHGQQIRGKVEGLLESLGISVHLCADSHLCCGSAGTYSILQANLSEQLRAQKLQNLEAACTQSGAKTIVSGNIGCISHLHQDDLPVRHWIEIIDQLLPKNP
ncbi:glycolate oxidase subunit GlcF [Polynucleobacter sp. HIN9]|uniref:glycolate oxidase subunit GlcF n=1 Tax=Polynucleobacter sp. HIN9 TaxID=3047868 RepID=UPI002572CFD6|nr:glycolate oxidase subunit GlcF [Polynucleobacter sp. HIN9]BEI41549.1 glycolate oxidase subunit GlcF [Polynucleobacter sp. HIN9]